MVLRISLMFVVVGIAYLSLTPSDTMIVGNDKLSHFIAYAVLMVNIGLLTYLNKKNFVIGIIASLLYGGILEVIQDSIPGRYMSIYDMIANAIGVFIGAILIFFFYHRLVRLLKKAKIIR